MKLAKRFFKKYLLSTLIILILFFVLNIILICGTLLMAWNNSTDPDIPVQTISKNITLNVDGTISSTDYIENILKNKILKKIRIFFLNHKKFRNFLKIEKA